MIQDSVELWIHLISFYLNYDSLEMGIEAFQAGVRALKSKSMPLWEILILYMGNTHPKLVKYLRINIFIVFLWYIFTKVINLNWYLKLSL